MLGEIARADPKLGGRPAGQNGNRVLELGTLRTYGGKLGLGRGDLGVGGGHIAQSHREAGFVLVVHDLIGFFVFRDRAREQRDQGIRRAEIEIGDGKLRLRRELGVVEIGGARLRAGSIGFDLPPHAAPDVQVPGRADRHAILGPVDGAPAAANAPRTHAGVAADGQRPGPGAGHAVAGRGDRKQRGLAFPDDGARLLVSRRRSGDCLIRDLDLRQELVERAVLVSLPPIAAIDIVARPGALPAFQLLKLRGDWSGLRRVIGADCAACERQRDDVYCSKAAGLARVNEGCVAPKHPDAHQHGRTPALPETRC